MSGISIEQPPIGTDIDLTSYLARRFIDVNNALGQTNYFKPIYEMPNDPLNGTIQYFGEPIAPLITEPGFWGYEQGLWIKL